MDLKQAIFVLLALVSTTNGFIPHRQARQRFRPRRRQSISLQHSLTGGRPGPQSNINQRLRVRTPSQNNNAINIIANIVLRNTNHNRGNGPNRNHGHAPAVNRGHRNEIGQGHGYPQQPEHGVVGHGGNQGRGTGLNPHGAQGYNLLPGHARQPSQRGATNSNGPRSIQSLLGALLGQGAVGSAGAIAGAQHALGRNGLDATNLAALLQNIGHQTNLTKSNTEHASESRGLNGVSNLGGNTATGTVSPLNSHIVILPNGPNTRTLVLAPQNGIGIKPVKTNGGQGALIITSGNQAGAGQEQSLGFRTMTTIKPGEDLPEFEQL